jgi:hypothetical protein
MRAAPQDTQGGVKTVNGGVSAAGAIGSGTGFTVTKTATGQYTVRFVPAFKALHSVVATVAAGNTANVLLSTAADSFSILTFATSTNAATDTAFQFTATGMAR